MSMAKKMCAVGSVIFLLLFVTGCSLFGPSLSGKTHVLKAIDGANKIEATKEGKEVNEKLVELFNDELVLAYQETEQAINKAKADVSLYLDMPIKSYEKLATLYESIASRYGRNIISAADYPALVKDLGEKASKDLFETATSISKSSNEYDTLHDAIFYLQKAVDLNSEYEEKANEILIDVYIHLGDIKVESAKVSDIEVATSYYTKALTRDKTNEEASAKLAYAKEKLITVKVASIQNTLESGKTYQEFNDALRRYKGLGSEVKIKYEYLKEALEKKLTADILVLVGPEADMSLVSPQESTPSWPLNVSDERPQKIVVEYQYMTNPNMPIPTTHTYVLVPDADFTEVSYSYDMLQSDRKTIWATENPLERAGYEALLQDDPDNIEAQKGLESGTYDTVTYTAKQNVNDVYHIYKVENEVPKLLYSTAPNIYKKEFVKYRLYRGSAAPIEKEFGIRFAGIEAGEDFDSTKIESYFKKYSPQQIYARMIKDIKPFYDFLW